MLVFQVAPAVLTALKFGVTGIVLLLHGLGILHLSLKFIHMVPASKHRILIGWHVSTRLSLFHGHAWPSFFIFPSQSRTSTSQPRSLSVTVLGKRTETTPQFQSKIRDSIMHNMPTLKSSCSLSYLCGLLVIKKKMWTR